MLRYFTHIRILIATIIILVILRIAILPFSPPGFFLDEAASGTHVIAMLASGTNAHGQPWPLFSASLGGGYTTPIYLYPLTAWAALFGTSEFALRLFSQVTTIGAILLLGWTLRLWLGKKTALVAVVAGLVLPWGWLQGSLAWDPALIPLIVSLAFYGFSLSWLASSPKQRLIGLALLPTSLIALAYLYPPCRVTAPLLFAGAYFILYRRKLMSLRGLITTAAYSILLTLPLLFFMLQPESLARSREVSVFHDQAILTGLGQVFVNIGLLINPLLLFVYGDPNLRHATGPQGMLGIAAVLPLMALAWYAFKKRSSLRINSLLSNKRALLVLIALFGIASSLLGSALTNEGQPHSLRASAAWLFVVLLITIGWTTLWKSRRRWLKISALVIFVVGTIGYAVDLAFFYPARATDSFDTSIRAQIHQGYPPAGYPEFSLKYYSSK